MANLYVYFNNIYEFMSVSGRKFETSHHRWAVFPQCIAEGFILGTKKMGDYIVVEDRVTGKIELSKKESYEIVVRTIDNLLYKVPNNISEYDFKIHNDTTEKKLTFMLSQNLRNATLDPSQPIVISGVSELNFYFTKKDDPHVLYKHVLVVIEEIFQNDIISDYVEPLNNVSVFTKRVYENYWYEEI